MEDTTTLAFYDVTRGQVPVILDYISMCVDYYETFQTSFNTQGRCIFNVYIDKDTFDAETLYGLRDWILNKLEDMDTSTKELEKLLEVA